MKTICFECGADLKVEYERIEFDGELRVELAHCSKCDPQETKLESKLESEYERGYEDGREECEEDFNEDFNEDIHEEWEQKIEKFEIWIKNKFLLENYDLYKEINQKLIDLELI